MIRDRSFTAAAGARLDAALLAAFPSTTRAFVRDAIARGGVLVIGRRAPKGMKLKGGEEIAGPGQWIVTEEPGEAPAEEQELTAETPEDNPGDENPSDHTSQEDMPQEETEAVEEQGYDGVNNSDEEIIAFKPEQIKSVTDNIGTFDRNNPNTRYSARENTLAEQNASAYNGRDPKLNRAVELVRSGAQPSTIYNETGYVRMANGNLIDPDTGEIVWRYHNDISESSDEFSAGREEGREPETGVPGNDRRGLRGLDGETIPEGTGSGKKTGRAWRSVEAAVRKNITDTITRFASEHSRKELRIFRGAVAESKFVCLKSKTNDDKIDAVNDNV